LSFFITQAVGNMAQLGISMIATSTREWIDFCRAAEVLGLAGAWTADTFGRDSFIDAGLALSHTRNLTVGLGVALPTRTPLQTARAAAVLGEFEGRFRLGFGVGHSDREGARSLRFFQMAGAGAMESAHGIPFHPPLSRMKDFLDCVLGLLYADAGAAVEIVRPHFRSRGNGFGYTASSLPLMLGGWGPKMCELSGERGSGVLLHHLAPRSLVAQRACVARQAHARAALSTLPFTVSFGLIASVDRDEALALRRAQAELVGALGMEEYRERLRATDAALAEQLGHLIDGEQYAAAAQALPEEIVRDMILVSTPARFRRDIDEFKESDLVLTLPAGIFAPLCGDRLGFGAADWKATRANLVEAIFDGALTKLSLTASR
jgi:alkanesulfonate monooxygenase SsuD/methylene tetrahydromethanopterin reductase-like flavin-dependent oxidoreductase (luciferase family)